MVSVNQIVFNFFSTLFVLITSFNLVQSRNKKTMEDFLKCLNRRNIINISIFFYICKMILSESFSSFNRTLSTCFPDSSITKAFLDIVVSLFGNSLIIQGLKNAVIECFVIVLFCKRQFSLQPSLMFGGFMLFRALHEPWIEKFRTVKRNPEDYSSVGRFFLLLFVGLLIHYEILLSKILLNFYRFRTVNIIVGFELIFLSSSMRGFLIDQIFVLVNELFLDGEWLSEDSCSLYLRFVVFFMGGITYKYALDCLNISNKGIFKYYLLRRSFQCVKSYIESLEESTRYRKTTVSVGSLLRNPTPEEIKKLDVQACVICRGEMVPGFSKILSCGHIYHIRCLQNWVRRQYCCPTCLAPISSDSLYSVKKQSDFLRKNFEKKHVNMIAATTGLTREVEISSREMMRSSPLKSLPTLNPDLTSILFKKLFTHIVGKKTTCKSPKVDFYLKLLEKVENARKTILKDFYLITEKKSEISCFDNGAFSGWFSVDYSSLISRIQGTLSKIEE